MSISKASSRGIKKNKGMHKLYTTVPNKGRTLFHERADEINLLENLPTYDVERTDTTQNPVIISGPYDRENAYYEFTQSFGSSISTYPHYPAQTSRNGDPICDSYRVHTFPNGVVACVSDGCGWGEKSKEASVRARDAFSYYLEQNVTNIHTVNDAGPLLVNALSIANHVISYDKPNLDMAGTTTLLGGVLLKLDDPTAPSEFVFVSISIGDCKAFHYDISKNSTVDISAGNRNNLCDPRDPGGRLGPYYDADPDLRNLEMYVTYCNTGDIMMIVSDGVHDNLDPQALGIPPTEFGIQKDNWKEVEYDEGIDVKIDWMNTFLTDMVRKETGEVISPKLLTKKLLRHCIEMTAAGRQWMEQNPKLKLPSDYTLYPGKMDHTTCIAFRVGLFDPSTDTGDHTESLDPNI